MSRLKGILRLTWTEIRHDWMWHAAWAALIFIYTFIAVSLYPGEDAVRELFSYFQNEDIFKAFLGEIGGEHPTYILWISMMFSFISIMFFLFGIMTGPRLVLRAVDNGIGELLHVMPMRRITLHGVRLLESFLITVGLFAFMGILLVIPWADNNVVPSDRVVLLVAWGIIFVMMSMTLGMVLGLLSGTSGKGIQLGLFMTLLLFAIQSLARVQPEQFGDVNEWNILSWYDVNSILLNDEMPPDPALKIGVFFIIVLLISAMLFETRDLMKNPPIPLLNKLGLDSSVVRKVRSMRISFGSEKKSIFTFWARPLEKPFPFAADFIYSERLVLLFAFWGVILIWPFQLIFYPTTPEGVQDLTKAIVSFGDTPYMRLFTYGHDLSSDPYLWFLVTQALGNHWFLFVPLVVYWVGKIVRRDTDSLTGEIMGSLAVSNRRVILERVFAASLELVIIAFQMVAWIIISEYGVTGKTERTLWEVIAIISVLPMYVFLLTGSVALALLLKKNGLGVKISRVLIFALLLAFMVGKMVKSLDQWYVTLLFGLYDPVLIVKEQSILVNNNGILIHLILAFFSIILLCSVAHLYQWMYIDEHETKHEEVVREPIKDTTTGTM